MQPVYINEIAAFLPNDPVDNESIEKVLGALPHQPARVKKFVLRNNGIRTRHYAIDPATGVRTHTNAQLTAEAIRRLLDALGLDKSAVEGLACGTSSADQLIPAHAMMVAGELGLPPCEIVSSAGVCCSGVAALRYGHMAVASGSRTNFVVTGSECASPFMRERNYRPVVSPDPSDPTKHPIASFEMEFLRWMLSDGAGAAWLDREPRPDGLSLKIEWVDQVSWAGELPVCMYSGMVKDKDGRLVHWFDEENRYDVVGKGYLTLQQDVRALDRHIIETAMIWFERLRERHDVDYSQVSWFLPHLSSMYFKGKVMEGMNARGMHVAEERWFTNLPDKGNTGSASIYIMLEELFHSGRLRSGDRILCIVPESARFTMAAFMLTVC
jgi:3-oxoacyl-[acyl-carrier-protein] synthase-3